MPKSTADIPGNGHALEKLQEVLDSGEAIAFVGAGAGAGLYPLWDQLIRQLADAAVDRGLADDADRRFWLKIAGARPQEVVCGIKQKLGDGPYGEILRTVFGHRQDDAGHYFTEVQGALVRMPFRGYVTTNYDPGLIEARRKLRMDVRDTGYCTWKDEDTVYRWLNGVIFTEQSCPVLFAHGIYERSDTIVLGVDEYREAYQRGVYRRLFDKLWSQDRLVLVGVGFSDPRFNFLADEVLTESGATRAGEPRHVAIIGLREEETYSSQMREMFRDSYNADVVLYPVVSRADGTQDHSALLEILEGGPSTGPRPTAPVPSVPGAPAQFALILNLPRTAAPEEEPPQRWTHETTNDDRYVGRESALQKLDWWADDPDVRVIGITGMGGLGKTALIGHWLKKRGGDVRRPNRGLFFWSFYADRSIDAFIEALLEFAVQEVGIAPPQADEPQARYLAASFRDLPVLLVLDGLEVLQEQPGTVAYGLLLENDLRDLVDSLCSLSHRGLVVLTSRFPFNDLTPSLGGPFRTLDLDRLALEESAALLQSCGVQGTDADRREVGRRFDGHPLALRIFAAALATQADGDPTRFYEMVFTRANLSTDAPLDRKLRHLLSFYEDALPPARVALLGIVSLFRTTVDESTILTLAGKLPSVGDALGGLSGEQLHSQLQALRNDHLILCEQGAGGDAYSCHPILRDHFRETLLGRDESAAEAVADLLQERPATGPPTTARELEPIIEAIELLLAAGNIERADELFVTRLENGEVFKHIPAYHEGVRCALAFVSDDKRRQACAQRLSNRRYSFYLNAVGLWASHAGEIGLAGSCHGDSLEARRKLGDKAELAVGLQNYTSFLSALGRLADAESAAGEALALTKQIPKELEVQLSLSCLGNARALRGQPGQAMADFEEANAIEMHTSDGTQLYSLTGVQWADLLLRGERSTQARELTRTNLEICERNRWREDVARCHWILGRADTVDGDYASAREHLLEAEGIMRRGHQLQDMTDVLLARANLERCEEEWEGALRYAGEALRLAMPRGMRLNHADGLVMRGRIRLERAQSETENAEDRRPETERAQDDADAALHIARDCGYAWAERDALRLLVETWEELGDAAKALEYRQEYDALAARLRLD